MAQKKTSRSKKNFLIFVLFAIIAVGSWQLITVRKDFNIAVTRIETIQNEIARERQEKEEYKLQAADLNSKLKTANEELKTARSRLKKLSALEADNAGLLQTRQQLAKKIADLEEEKRLINIKLHSLKELKKLVRQAKIEIRDEKIRKEMEREQIQKELDAQKTSMGNKGFLMQNGKSSYKPSVNIEVKPAI